MSSPQPEAMLCLYIDSADISREYLESMHHDRTAQRSLAVLCSTLPAEASLLEAAAALSLCDKMPFTMENFDMSVEF